MRLAVIYFRIAMILTAFRAAENDHLETDIYCHEDDFINADRIINVYRHNFIAALKMMPTEAIKIDNRSESKFFELLPVDSEFTTAEAKALAKEHGIASDRSVDNYLRNLRTKGLIVQGLQYGTYKKVMPN
jgi:hypothetical protein